ncbi:MAG: GGDEF domain-containing protein [Lachnospiraceae bacterium]|nr:GGDEF domain-containing protein [Lachnospiraceae bacterium]
MKGNSNRRLAIEILIAILLFVIYLFLYLGISFDAKYAKTVYNLTNENWYIVDTTDLDPEEDLTTSSHVTDNMTTIGLDRGKTIILATKLPNELFVSPCMQFNVAALAVRVYYDGNEIYSYGTEDYEAGRFVGKQCCRISIPAEAVGKNVCIEYRSTRQGKNINHSSTFYGEASDVFKAYLQQRRFPLFAGTFLVIFGLMLIITLPLMSRKSELKIDMIFHGLLLFDSGIYFLSYNNLMQYYVTNNWWLTTMEYLSLFMIPFLVQGTVLFNRYVRQKGMSKFMFFFDLSLPVVTMILHCLGISHMYNFLTIAHVFIILQGAYSLFVMVRQLRYFNRHHGSEDVLQNGERAANAIMIGVNCLTCSSVFDVVFWYVLEKLGYRVVHVVNGVFSIMGSLILVACIVLSYFYHVIANENEKEIRGALEGIAFNDILTQISNRAHCEQVMEELTREQRTCIVISLDLDHLKQVNDNLGHQIGDKMISGFAELLRQVFVMPLLLGRMGGDEFIVILDGDDVARCERLLYQLTDYMNSANAQLTMYSYSASWGYAGSYEVADGHIQKTYMLADERMYRMKEEHHAMDEKLRMEEIKTVAMQEIIKRTEEGEE